jgi:iron(III) transport system permease protein
MSPAERFLPAALALLVAALVAVPLGAVISGAANVPAGDTLRPLLNVLGATNIIGNTLLLGLGATTGAVLVGGGLALALVRIATPGRRLLEQLVILPLYLTPLLTAVAWSWLGTPRAGLINLAARRLLGISGTLVDLQGAGGVIFVAGLSAVPVPFLLIGAALRAMDPSLEESARVHGASAARAMFTVTLRLVLPAAAASALLVLVQAMSLFSVPAVLGVPGGFPTAGTEIYRLLNTYPARLTQASAWGLLLLAATGALVWLQSRILRGRSFTTITGKAFRPRALEIGPARYVLAAFAWAYIVAAVLLPVATITWAAFVNFLTLDPALIGFDFRHVTYILFDYPKTWLALRNSLMLAFLGATLCCGLGLAIGWAVVRSRSRLRPVLDQAAMLPIAIPSMVLALGLLWAYAGNRWIPIYATIWILLLAYVTHFLPFAVRAATGGLRQLHPELEEAASVFGAGWFRRLRGIVAPLLLPTLASAWTLIFVLALQEVSASFCSTPAARRSFPSRCSTFGRRVTSPASRRSVCCNSSSPPPACCSCAATSPPHERGLRQRARPRLWLQRRRRWRQHRDRRGRTRHPPRTFRLWQDHHASRHRGAGNPTRRPHRDRREDDVRRRRPPQRPARAPRCLHGVPVVRDLAAHDGVRERRLRSAGARRGFRRRRDRRQRRA